MEFSRIAIALDASGLSPDDPIHGWGSLAAQWVREGTLDAVGRQMAVTLTRNGAKNQTYRLSEREWKAAGFLSELRGWTQRVERASEQLVLV